MSSSKDNEFWTKARTNEQFSEVIENSLHVVRKPVRHTDKIVGPVVILSKMGFHIFSLKISDFASNFQKIC